MAMVARGLHAATPRTLDARRGCAPLDARGCSCAVLRRRALIAGSRPCPRLTLTAPRVDDVRRTAYLDRFRRSTTCRSPSRAARRSRCSARTAAGSRRCSSCSTVSSSPTPAPSAPSASRRHRGRPRRRAVLARLPVAGRLRVPELRRAGVLADGARGDRVRPAQHGPRAATRSSARVDDTLAHARHRRARRPRAVPAVGRPEEAGRHRVGARDEPRGAAVRRADRGARPPHAGVARRAHRRAQRRGQDHRARHARPRHASRARRSLRGVRRGASRGGRRAHRRRSSATTRCSAR